MWKYIGKTEKKRIYNVLFSIGYIHAAAYFNCFSVYRCGKIIKLNIYRYIISILIHTGIYTIHLDYGDKWGWWGGVILNQIPLCNTHTPSIMTAVIVTFSYTIKWQPVIKIAFFYIQSQLHSVLCTYNYPITDGTT